MAVDDTTETVDDIDTGSSVDSELDDVELSTEDIAGLDTDDDEAEQSEAESEDEETITDDSEDETEAEDNTEEEESTEQSDEDKRKQEAREHYEQRQAEKQARISRVKQDQANYIAEASENRDPLELAVRQLQVSEYNNTVEAVSNKLTNGYERALNDFEVLRTSDPVVQAEIDQAIDAFQALNVTIDAYGNPTEVRGDLYATLQAKADSIAKLTGIRNANQERSKGKEKSKTLITPTRAPREPKKDADIEAFDEEAYR